MSGSASSTAARKCKYLSYTLLVILYTGMPYNLLVASKRLCCAEIEVYQNVRHNTFSEINLSAGSFDI
jgi:hypothetical protein